MKNIAYIQDFDIISDEQILKYMGNIKHKTEADVSKIYKFIVCCNKRCKITNFCLSINSGTLTNLNILIQDDRSLDNCIFIATRSNANSVRETIAKNIYFSLSEVSVLIKDYLDIEPYNVMTIVSDTRTPYFDEIYELGPKPAYRISELTVEKMNEFVDNPSGNSINLLIAINNSPINEFEHLRNILLNPACKYKNFATFIEIDNRDIPDINLIDTKLVQSNNIASNVSINGLTNLYPDINFLTLYNNCSIQLVNEYDNWENYVNDYVVFNRFSGIPPTVKEKTITQTKGLKKVRAKTQLLTSISAISIPELI